LVLQSLMIKKRVKLKENIIVKSKLTDREKNFADVRKHEVIGLKEICDEKVKELQNRCEK
jgi:hypothetical protein